MSYTPSSFPLPRALYDWLSKHKPIALPRPHQPLNFSSLRPPTTGYQDYAATVVFGEKHEGVVLSRKEGTFCWAFAKGTLSNYTQINVTVPVQGQTPLSMDCIELAFLSAKMARLVKVPEDKERLNRAQVMEKALQAEKLYNINNAIAQGELDPIWFLQSEEVMKHLHLLALRDFTRFKEMYNLYMFARELTGSESPKVYVFECSFKNDPKNAWTTGDTVPVSVNHMVRTLFGFFFYRYLLFETVPGCSE